jgi:hypothetical protein
MAGQPAEETAYSRTAFDWADRTGATAGPQLVSLALQALAGITGHASELACTWDEVPSTWPASIAELMAMLLDVSPGSGKEQIEHELLPGRFYQSAVKALTAIPDADVPSMYAVSFYFWYQQEEPRWPALTIGYNTEARVQRALTGPSDGCFNMPADEDGHAGTTRSGCRTSSPSSAMRPVTPSAPNSSRHGSAPMACGIPDRMKAPKRTPLRIR